MADGPTVKSAFEGGTDEEPLDAVEPAVHEQFRAIIRIHLSRPRRLRVGDKFANRHGHKGVVGLILPDGRMPRWRGRPVEALIDPVSVVNHGSWGQVYESLAEALASKTGPGWRPRTPEADVGRLIDRFRTAFAADRRCRVWLEAPGDSPWFRLAGAKPRFQAVVGEQFVLRLPQRHDPTSKGRRTADASRGHGPKDVLGLQAVTALWAHNLIGGAPSKETPAGFSPPAAWLRRLLWLAGVSIVGQFDRRASRIGHPPRRQI